MAKVLSSKVQQNRRSDLMTRRYEEKIEPHLSKIAIEMSRGGNIENVASIVGMSNETFMKYRRAFPELNSAIEAGKKESVEVAEDSLQRLAEGYYYNEIQEDQHPITFDVIKRRVTKKYHHPEFKAIMAILLNRASEKWSKNPDNNTGSNVGIINNLDVSDKTIQKALQELNINSNKIEKDLEIDAFLK